TDTPTVEVTDGDLEIDDKNIKVASDDVTLIIPVKTDSREASTIVISDITVDLDRTIPEGTFKLEIGGDALVENYGSASADYKEGKFRTDYVAKVEFANVVTPNPEDLSSGKASAQKATFTVGSVDYTVGEEVATADVAPYIKDGRTMIPVKYVAYALGIDPSNIKWDQATKTVTILGDRVVQVKIGSKDLVVNGAVLTMDAAAEVKDGRTFLPISWVASALNVPYSWDDATKTVTFN
ncbi:MAG: copper amine oxidase N-terminal domain-containing protein, partial [Epulopiscium sp.]|nr:copper amine oxidase N-terminal domain-containing protein [Candidatus Epulonipiscium sp.]